MAKKRVHEIAKEQGITSKEALAILQKAGVEVTAAASSVEEAEAARAFGNGAPSRTAPKADAQASDSQPAAAQAADGAQRGPAQQPAAGPQGGGAQARPQGGGQERGGAQRQAPRAPE